jgi:TonB family protein
MRHILTAVIFLASLRCTAQDAVTRMSTGWQYTQYYPNGQIHSIGMFVDSAHRINNGPLIWFDSTGKRSQYCTFQNLTLSGPDTTWYPNGQIKTTGSWKEGQRDGPWIGFYPSGQPSGKAMYLKGRASRVVAYKEDGTVNKAIKDFSAFAAYPGGPDNWQAYFERALINHRFVIEHHPQGDVYIRFKVAIDGKISDFSVSRSSGDPSLDEVALDVIKKSGRWDPEVDGGRVVEAYVSQPIFFRLNH